MVTDRLRGPQTEPSQTVLPFFVGSGRSGTTLVQAIFSAHPLFAIAHESQFVPRLARRRYVTEDGFDSEAFLRDLHRSQDFLRLALDVEALRRDLEEAPPTGYADAVRRVFRVYSHSRGKPWYGDKTPGYILHMDLLADLFPEARFIHVLRDGRDVALSYLETRFGPRTVAEAALYWQRRVTAGRSSGTRLGHDRYRELRYEDLIANPESIVRDLCPFLGVDFVPAMLRYHEDAARLRSDTADPSAHRHVTRPPTAGLRDWRAQMAPGDVGVFEALAGGTLEAFGYPRSAAKPPVVALPRAAAGWVFWQVKRGAVRTAILAKRRRRASSSRSLGSVVSALWR